MATRSPDFVFVPVTGEVVEDTNIDVVKYLKPDLEDQLGQRADFIVVAVPHGEARDWLVKLEARI